MTHPTRQQFTLGTLVEVTTDWEDADGAPATPTEHAAWALLADGTLLAIELTEDTTGVLVGYVPCTVPGVVQFRAEGTSGVVAARDAEWDVADSAVARVVAALP